MDPAASAVTLVVSCIQFGKILHSRCKAYKDAEAEVTEAALSIESYWLKIEYQIDTLHKVWHILEHRLQVHQNHVLQILQTKLQAAVNTLDELIGQASQDRTKFEKILHKSGDTRRLKYAAYAKESLENVISSLDKWQKTFDPSWFLLARMAVPQINQQLDQAIDEDAAEKSSAVSALMQLRDAQHKGKQDQGNQGSVFLPPSWASGERRPIPFTTACVTCDATSFIMDPFPIKIYTSIANATKAAKALALILAKVDPETFGLLVCEGVVKHIDDAQKVRGFDFALRIPDASCEPRSLRSLLIDSTKQPPLTQRLKLAKSLARSLIFLHDAEIVHKSISPETIVLLRKAASTSIGTPYLIGFEQFRFAEGKTYRVGDSKWDKNLYRHPQRQGEHPEEDYVMQHDIYSLGVCLLEIGIWQSFATYDANEHGELDPCTAQPSPIIPIAKYLDFLDPTRGARFIKRLLVRLANEQLPNAMGDIYTEIVVSCLTCLDKNNTHFGDEYDFEDEDGILVGVRYIEKILFEIERIVM